MLELRTYTKDEITGILDTTDRQGVKRKLDGYGVEYTIEGWKNYTLTITAINDPFRLFCITLPATINSANRAYCVHLPQPDSSETL